MSTSVPQIILYVDGAILLVFALMYVSYPFHLTLVKMIGLPQKNSSPETVSMLLSIDGFSKLGNALMMIFGAIQFPSPYFLLAVALAHFFWSFLQFDQSIRYYHILAEHAQPNIGCLQVLFGSSLLFYAFQGLNIWSNDTVGVIVCSAIAVVGCVGGQVVCRLAVKDKKGGEVLLSLDDNNYVNM